MKHHLIISGTGRTGTTFLVQLFTALRLDTGFSNPHESIFENCNAGMEWDIRREDAPYIVKSPAMCEYIGAMLQSREVAIDHAIIPMRDLYAAAESRRDVERRSDPALFEDGMVNGGLIGRPGRLGQPEEQETLLAQRFHNLVYALVRHDVPMIFLDFPRFIAEPEYLFDKLHPVMPGVFYTAFSRAHAVLAQPEIVHEFTEQPDEPCP